MTERSQLEAVFLEQLPTIDRIVSLLARRYGLGRDDANDALSWIRLKLIESDYAAIAKFRGESTIQTYLAVVVAMSFREYRVQRWGRWRPSAAARRSGTLAVRLETLVRRDKHPLEEAGELLRTSGETSMTNRELTRLLQTLPEREPLRPIDAGEEPLAFEEAATTADGPIAEEENSGERATIRSALSTAIESLDPQDRVIVHMHFWDGSSVADISRGLGVVQKPLYRRLERTIATLRERLSAAGISEERVRDVFSDQRP